MDKDNYVKENAEINRKMILWSCDQENGISATYSNFMTTLAGLFLTLSPLILDKLSYNFLIIKIFFSVAFFFIFLSLVFGGIYIFLKRNFFSKWTDNYSTIFSKWNNCKNKEDEKQASSCEECIYSSNKATSPQWPMIIQTLCLFIGILIEVSLFIINIFI
ncbi:hypothetical protein GW758_02735 [Candidatus Falkowbacteria bacterium]|nr:hypothetical protein [Candidatus Falkowbacteria bacterium]